MKKVGIVYDSSQKSKGHHGTHFAFTGLPGVEIVLADPNLEGIAARMQAIGAARRYADYREMLVVEAPDVVVVCSRLPADHFPVIRAAAERGCHLFCEKPLTDSLAEADAIAGLAERHRIKIAVAHLARHARVFRTMKRLIGLGEIGRPLTFYGRGKEDERGGGEDLVVLGTHILDIGLYLFGMPEYVFADNNRFAAWDLLQAVEEENRQPQASVHDAVHVLEMIYGIYAASLSKRGIPLPLVDRTHPLG